jgi:glycosyltransferase involved in cell wall biosynthesis
MKESIAVCIVVNDLYFESRYVVENLINKTKLKFKLYVLDNASSDERVKEYYSKLCEKKKWLYQSSESKLNYSKALNTLLKLVTEDYIALIPVNCLLNSNWLEDLLSNIKTVDSSGLISIKNSIDKLFLVPVLHHSPKSYEDKLKNVYVSETNAVEGVLFFNKNICFEKVGFFNEKFENNGYEQIEFSYRFTKQGFNNIYIRKQSLIKLNLQNQIIFPKKTKDGFLELKEEIKNMAINQNFKK